MTDGDLVDVLPAVVEFGANVDGEHGNVFNSSNVSQFSLLEESRPSLPSMPLSVPTESLHTLEVLA